MIKRKKAMKKYIRQYPFEPAFSNFPDAYISKHRLFECEVAKLLNTDYLPKYYSILSAFDATGIGFKYKDQQSFYE